MSNKLKKLLFTLVIALLALPTFGGSVLAAEDEVIQSEVFEETNYIMLKSNENVDSSAARSFSKPALFKDDNGTKTIQLNFRGSKYITELSVRDVNTQEVIKNDDGETGYISFTVDGEIPDVLYVDMTIGTPMGTMNHVVRLFLGVESVSDVSTDLLDSSLIKDEMNYVILKSDANEVSSSARSFNNAFKWYENDSALIDFNFVGTSMIKSLTVRDYEVSRVDAGEMGVLTVSVAREIPKVLYMDMKIETPRGGMEHTVRVFTDVESISDIPETLLNSTLIVEEPKEEIVEEPKEEPKEELEEDKIYEFDYIVKHETNNEASAADGFFLKPATLITENGVNYLQLTVTNWSMIDYLKTIDGDVKVIKENSDGSAFIQFKVGENLADTIILDMKITVPDMYSDDHKARLILDLESKKEVTEETKTEPVVSENPKDKVVPPTTKKPKAEVSEPKVEEEPSQLVPDKAYTVSYTIKHATENRESAANQFFTNDAVLLTKNGVNYLQMTVANWSMVDSLSTPQGEAVIIRENSDGSALIQIRVNKDLSAPVVLAMTVTVPGMYESMEHEARLFIDESTLKEVSVGDQKIAASTNGNGIMVNPQTGENSSLLLLTLLLVGSGSVLAYAVRKRFVA